ncbi:MAG: hypothetical protein V4547_17770 [Bacteroidota bacterium]
MDSQSTKNTRYISGVSEYVINGSDDFILVDTNNGPVDLYLPNIVGSGLPFSPKKFYISDNTGNAATNNITIRPSGANAVNSAQSFVLQTAFETAECEMASQTEWLILSDASSGGSTPTVTTIDYDLTGSDTMDLTGYTGELIVNVSSTNPTETLRIITASQSVNKITLRPEDILGGGFLLTVEDAASAPLVNNIKLNAPSLPVYGQYLGFLTIERRGAKYIFQTNYIDQYNS